MPQVARGIVKARAQALRELGARRLQAHLDAQIGKTLRVLSERGGNGRAEDFTLVRLGEVEPGLTFNVRTTGHDGDKAFGQIL
jgi:threonylcarbamoyladenosine tRNA methylthiotransferase MtaB